MRTFIYLLLFCLCWPALAQAQAKAAPQPLPIEQAFQFSATARDYQTVLFIWKIAPGYYLYRNRIRIYANDPQHVRLGQPLLPHGIKKSFPQLGNLIVYKDHLTIPLPIIQAHRDTVAFNVTYQGCADSGYCYPPITKRVTLNLQGQYMQPMAGKTVANTPQIQNGLDRAAHLLSDTSLWAIMLGFFGFGLLISLTPCVLPMIPILSSIILGHEKMTHTHAFLLSLSYVLGMAITYAVAGVVFGLIGGTLQALMQQAWIIVLFSLIFVALALSMFGVYELQLPETLRSKFAHLSEHQKHGTYLGVFVMGCFSTLILSPCVTPPLVGVLSYIGQTGNATLGGSALFVMGLGMGLPLLLIGATSARWLPKAGAWMNAIKNAMGILLLAVAIYMVERILPTQIGLFLWASLCIGTAVFMGALQTAKTHARMISKGFGVLLFCYGIVIIVGSFFGATNPLQPIPKHLYQKSKAMPLEFISVKTVSDVERVMSESQHQGKPVMLDFFAEWCISCKIMDNSVFTDPKIVQRLNRYVLLRADVTNNDAQDKALERHFNVVAPPTILFFNRMHREVPDARVVGEMSSKEFMRHLQQHANALER